MTIAAVCLLLAGCGQASAPTAPPSTSVLPSPSATITSASSGSSTPSAAVTAGSSTPPVSTPTLPTVGLPDYAGPQEMPASDGKPMLWPVPLPVRVDSNSTDPITLYGFLDVHGRLVLPQRYSSYLYCPDASDRALYLIAQRAGAKAEVYDLTGRLVRRLPTTDATCAGADHVVATHWVESELNQRDDELVDLRTGTVVVPMVKDRHINAIDDHTVNVSDRTGEYFLNLDTGHRTPHPGWVMANTVPRTTGAPDVVAAYAKRGAGRIGFLNPSGRWALTPRYIDSTGFTGAGYAMVQLSENRVTFLDRTLHESGDVWEEIDYIDRSSATDPQTLGYLATRSGEQALLGADLRPIVPAGPATITCDWGADGACSVTRSGGASELALPPSTMLTPLPSGYSVVLNSSFAADAGGGDTTRVLALASGANADLGSPTACHAAGTAWVVCDPAAETLAPIVLDDQGRRTALASAEPVLDPVPGAPVAYYQVTAGRYRGVLDEDGNWRYRQSSYTRLED